MILYLRICIIFWKIVKSSSYVLTNVFPNKVTSVLDGDLPAEVAPVRACTVPDSCSNNAVRCRFVGSWLLLLQTEQLSASCRKGKNNQSVYGGCTVEKKTSSSAFPISEGSNVSPLSSFLSFHLTQLLIHYGVIFTLFFRLLFSALISTFSLVPLFLCWCFHTVYPQKELDLCAGVAHISLSFDAAQFWGRHN